MMSWAAEIKVRAERKAGVLLKDMEMNKGNQFESETRRSHDVTAAPKLSDIGVDKSQSSRWQKMADIPEEAFEADIAKHHDTEKPVTTQAIMKVSKQAKKEKPSFEGFSVIQEYNLSSGLLSCLGQSPASRGLFEIKL